MSTESNETARIAALKFAAALASSYRAQLGEQLIGAYLIGSLAHGGFSRRYSDIDVALITEFALDTATLTTLRSLAAGCDATLGQKLSVFWSDRNFTVGRFPPLDRIDYLDRAVVLTERERVLPVRPTLDEIQAYLNGAPFANWTENVHRFAGMSALAPGDHKLFIRTLLYPARLVYSWNTGLMGSNDDAVAFTREHSPPGMNTDILISALTYRQAAADPDELFPARRILPDQIKSCCQIIGASRSRKPYWSPPTR
jgi:predicted nucleotidyltransferase